MSGPIYPKADFLRSLRTNKAGPSKPGRCHDWYQMRYIGECVVFLSHSC